MISKKKKKIQQNILFQFYNIEICRFSENGPIRM